MQGADHGAIGSSSQLVGGSALLSVGEKLKKLKTEVKKIDVMHLKGGEAANPIHGWISPKGEYFHLKPHQDHNDWISKYHENVSDAHKEGWIAAGRAGFTEVEGHSSILGNRMHPATRKLRELVGQHWDGDQFQIHMHDQPHSLHSVEAKHFSKFGTIKAPQATFKSLKEQLELLKSLIKP